MKAKEVINQTKLNYIIYGFAIFNLISVSISLFLGKINSSVLASAYGDFARTDLYYILVQGNFTNPYEFHPELPGLLVQPYLPLPFLLIKLFGIKVNAFSKDMFYVQAWTLTSIFLINYLVWKMLKGYKNIFRVCFIIGFGICSVPILYIFRTGNLQGYSTIIIFLAFINQKNRILAFVSTLLTVSFKPQYALINLANHLRSLRDIRFYFSALIAGGLLSLYGFSIFGQNILGNIKYFINSLGQFTNSKPEFMVHLNASVIGNLSSIEAYLFPENIHNLFVLKFQNYILGISILVVFYVLLRLVKSKNFSWPTVFILASIPIFLTPVSFSYSLTLLFIPLVLFLRDFKNNDYFTTLVIKDKFNYLFFLIALFLLFSPKPIRIVIIENITDTNLYTMIDSFGFMLIILVIIRSLNLQAKSMHDVHIKNR